MEDQKIVTGNATGPDLANDLMVGAPAIAEFLGWPPRRVYHVVEKKSRWPIWKDEGGIMARKSSLMNYIREREMSNTFNKNHYQ